MSDREEAPLTVSKVIAVIAVCAFTFGIGLIVTGCAYPHRILEPAIATTELRPCVAVLRHVLLGIKVLSGFGLALGGLYGFYYTLEKSRTLSPDAGLKLVLFYSVIMLAGGYLVADSLLTQGPPRCADNRDGEEQSDYDEKCF